MECKLCSRKFSSAKALGGHMRSHFATLPLPPKTPQRQELSEPLTDSTSSIFSSDDRESSGGEKSGLREKPKKSIRLVDPDFCDSVVDRQSESGSTRARGKRGKGMMSREEDDREVTKKGKTLLMSDLEMEEDVASCLVMLSRDVRRAAEELQMREKIFKCEECDGVFKSSQGLGSHKANHHQNKLRKLPSVDAICDNEFRKTEIHECGLCGKVFRSGKALGGHKRVHIQASKLGASLVERRFAIDLNLPPEIEVEDEEFDSY